MIQNYPTGRRRPLLPSANTPIPTIPDTATLNTPPSYLARQQTDHANAEHRTPHQRGCIRTFILIDAPKHSQDDLPNASEHAALRVVVVLGLALELLVVRRRGWVDLHVGRVADLPHNEGCSSDAGAEHNA